MLFPPKDNKTGLHRGFGWVRMSNDRDVQKVLWLKQHIIDGYDVCGVMQCVASCFS